MHTAVQDTEIETLEEEYWAFKVKIERLRHRLACIEQRLNELDALESAPIRSRVRKLKGLRTQNVW